MELVVQGEKVPGTATRGQASVGAMATDLVVGTDVFKTTERWWNTDGGEARTVPIGVCPTVLSNISLTCQLPLWCD